MSWKCYLLDHKLTIVERFQPEKPKKPTRYVQIPWTKYKCSRCGKEWKVGDWEPGM